MAPELELSVECGCNRAPLSEAKNPADERLLSSVVCTIAPDSTIAATLPYVKTRVLPGCAKAWRRPQALTRT